MNSIYVDYEKVIKVIASCRNFDHWNGAYNLVSCWETKHKNYKNIKTYNTLFREMHKFLNKMNKLLFDQVVIDLKNKSEIQNK